MTAAFYRTLLEVVLGEMLTGGARQEVTQTPSLRRHHAHGIVARVARLLQDWALDALDLLAMSADWQRDTFFGVHGSHMRYMPRSGVRPGQPLADLISNACMVVFLKGLNEQLTAHDLTVTVPKVADNPLLEVDDRPIHGDCLDFDGPISWLCEDRRCRHGGGP